MAVMGYLTHQLTGGPRAALFFHQPTKRKYKILSSSAPCVINYLGPWLVDARNTLAQKYFCLACTIVEREYTARRQSLDTIEGPISYVRSI